MATDESDALSPSDSQAEARALLHQLAGSIALLPQDLPDDAEQPPEGSIVLPVIEQGGALYVPVFTSEEALRAAGEDPDHAVPVPLLELAAGWPDDDLWMAVDPASEQGLTLPPDVVRMLPGLVGAGADGTP